jgi:hypothetical protein
MFQLVAFFVIIAATVAIAIMMTRSKWWDDERMPRPALTREVVVSSFAAIRDRFRQQLEELLRKVSADPKIGRLEIDLCPADANYRFPIRFFAFTKDRDEPNSDVNGFDAFGEFGPLLAKEYKWLALGRDDIGGLNFMPETDLVRDVLLDEVKSAWSALRDGCRADLDVLVGVDIVFSEDMGRDQPFLNLRTNQFEVFPARKDK